MVRHGVSLIKRGYPAEKMPGLGFPDRSRDPDFCGGYNRLFPCAGEDESFECRFFPSSTQSTVLSHLNLVGTIPPPTWEYDPHWRGGEVRLQLPNTKPSYSTKYQNQQYAMMSPVSVPSEQNIRHAEDRPIISPHPLPFTQIRTRVGIFHPHVHWFYAC